MFISIALLSKDQQNEPNQPLQKFTRVKNSQDYFL